MLLQLLAAFLPFTLVEGWRMFFHKQLARQEANVRDLLGCAVNSEQWASCRRGEHSSCSLKAKLRWGAFLSTRFPLLCENELIASQTSSFQVFSHGCVTCART